MTPGSRNSSLLDNGSLGTFPQQWIGLWENQTVTMKLTHVFAETDKHRIIEELLGGGYLYLFLPEVIKGGHVIDSEWRRGRIPPP
jgi:hypothetical protein